MIGLRLRCRFGFHKMEWDEHAYPGDCYMEPDEPGYICALCGQTYPDADPVHWRFLDWFFGETRLGGWYIDWRYPHR